MNTPETNLFSLFPVRQPAFSVGIIIINIIIFFLFFSAGERVVSDNAKRKTYHFAPLNKLIVRSFAEAAVGLDSNPHAINTNGFQNKLTE